jgi:dihydroorotate dehydrogenase (fumarate)
MGIELKNPLVVGSCGLVKTVDGVRKAAEAGAGAVVLKSLFEEQIQAENSEIEESMIASSHTEALEYVRADLNMQFGAHAYIDLIKECKKTVSIPVFASVNCVSDQWWTHYARDLEGAGPDGLEINLSRMPADPAVSGKEIEDAFCSIVSKVTSKASLPVAVKIGPHFTSLAHMAKRLTDAGASALVLFNRFYRPDIDITELKPKAALPFSRPEEAALPLRWMALLSQKIPCGLAASTGVHDSDTMAKMLLAGANVVQAASTFYMHGLGRIEPMLQELENWMTERGFDNLDEVRTSMQPELSENPEVRERLQYMRIFSGIE